MKKKQNIVPLKDLNLTDRFLFDEVLEDRGTYQDVLSIIFGREIPPLDQPQTEKELRVSPLIRSVRMDVFAMSEEQSIYNTEMQNTRKTDLAKRSRYYQSLIDTSLLEPGIPNYNILNQSYVIMIMTFDLFGYGKYVYTFENKCKEVPECSLGDGTAKIFLNTKGENADEVPDELIEFLDYVEHSTAETAGKVKSERVRRVHDRVCRVKLSEEVGVKYMQAWEEKYYEREEGRIEGRKEGRIEGREEGRIKILVTQVCKKLAKGMEAPDIADMLEEEESVIQNICDAAEHYTQDYDVESITMELLGTQNHTAD
ncbi:Rpn family recombination-promoting nuclease/putative transposase [Lachnospiraceae bacterium MD308]|nr:Rpn family recombination-promoting nuclease/putative transposase [Lachnospiraceae bacterium MD308]